MPRIGRRREARNMAFAHRPTHGLGTLRVVCVVTCGHGDEQHVVDHAVHVELPQSTLRGIVARCGNDLRSAQGGFFTPGMRRRERREFSLVFKP